MTEKLPRACIPRAVQLVLDDVGWREGWNVSDTGGPYRAGVDRLLDERDYAAVADIGEELTIRPQCAMILCEWDRENICAQYPTSTHLGPAWDNSHRVGDWALRARDIFVERAAHIEFAMHGVGHEHWDDGVRTRAEWHGSDGRRWPWDVLQGHLDCFRRIMAQYGLTPESGITFPPSFVPCAFCYYLDDADAESTGALMETTGVRYISTPYSSCTFAGGPSEKPDGGFDHGLLVLDRGNIGVPYDVYATVPQKLPATSICGIHWPNVLTEDPDRNREGVAIWIDYLRNLAGQPGVMLATNTAETFSQWVYHTYAELREQDGQYILDASQIPDAALPYAECPIVKLELPPREHLSAVESDDCRLVAYWERDGFGFLSLKMASSSTTSFRLRFGQDLPQLAVLRTGTFDVLDLEEIATGPRLTVRMYGIQELLLRLPFVPTSVTSNAPDLEIDGFHFCRKMQTLHIRLVGRDIHGEIGSVTVTRDA